MRWPLIGVLFSVLLVFRLGFSCFSFGFLLVFLWFFTVLERPLDSEFVSKPLDPLASWPPPNMFRDRFRWRAKYSRVRICQDPLASGPPPGMFIYPFRSGYFSRPAFPRANLSRSLAYRIPPKGPRSCFFGVTFPAHVQICQDNLAYRTRPARPRSFFC